MRLFATVIVTASVAISLVHPALAQIAGATLQCFFTNPSIGTPFETGGLLACIEGGLSSTSQGFNPGTGTCESFTTSLDVPTTTTVSAGVSPHDCFESCQSCLTAAVNQAGNFFQCVATGSNTAETCTLTYGQQG